MMVSILTWNDTKTVSAKTVKAGWVEQQEGIKYRNKKGVFAKSKWEKISGKWFYFNNKGVVVTGWKNLGGKTYYLKKTGKAGTRGAMLTGWNSTSKQTYYFNSSGAMQTGWVKLNNRWFYFKKTGKAGTKGKLWTGWLTLGGKDYYLRTSGGHGSKGRMLTGTHTIDGKECYFNSSGEYVIPLAERVTGTKIAKKAKQIITVADGKLTLWEKSGNNWKSILSVPCKVGKKGISANRTQGDMTTPAGAFTMTLSFGKGNNPGTKLPYRKITPRSYWIGYIKDKDYNTWQERDSGHPDDERLINYKNYKYVIAIDFNTERIPGKGSAIFLHCSGGSATAGCVAVPEATMLQLMKRVDKGSYIIIGKSEADISKY